MKWSYIRYCLLSLSCRLRQSSKVVTMKNMNRGASIFSIFFLVYFLFPSHAFAVSCHDDCPKRKSELTEKKIERDRMKIILSRNEDFLKRNPSANPSIVMKIQSNKIMARLEIETLENEILPLAEFVEKQGCSKCL